MEEKQNKTKTAAPPVRTSSQVNDDEEKDILKGANILIKDQKGKFSYVKGDKLLGEENAPKTNVIKPKKKDKEVVDDSVIQNAISQLTKKKLSPPVSEPKLSSTVPDVPKEANRNIKPEPSTASGQEVKQVTASQMKPAFQDRKIPKDGVNANFYFDVEDEEEVKQMHDEDITAAANSIDYGMIVKEIEDQVGVSFKESLFQKRFESLITSRLRDIRSSVQLRNLLGRPKKVGGLELEDEKIEQIVKATEEKAKKFHDNNAIKEIEMRQRMKLQEMEKEKAQQNKMRTAVANEQMKKAVLDLHKKNELENETMPEPQMKPIMEKPKKEKPVPIIPKVVRPMPEVDSRPKIVDIKTPSRLMGPIEEIRSLNLMDFRRLGANPKETIQKIKTKVDLLEEESFTKKAEAIKAWKESEIYQIYIDIGNEGMNKGKTVKDVIANRKSEGRSYLSEEEFEAVGDLNKQLRF